MMSAINILTLAAHAKMRMIQWRALLWCFLILVLDGYDLAIVGVALPSIMEQMAVSAQMAGWMASSALFGMIFGAIGLSALADKLGRRLVLSVCIFLFSVFTALAGLSDNPYVFSALRFIAGIGIGGAIPNTAAHMTEYAPKRLRGLLVMVMCCGYAVGGILSALIGKEFILSHGWQMVFYMAALPVVLIPFIFLWMPESMVYLLKKGNNQALTKIAKSLDPSLNLPIVLDTALPSDTTERQGIKGLFAPTLRLGTLMLWLAFVMSAFIMYCLSSWFVKLVSMMGHSLETALNLVYAFNIGGIVGAIVGGVVADRIGMRVVAVLMGLISVVSLIAFGFEQGQFFVVGALMGASILGSSILLYAYAAQFYPIHLRSFGVGTASGLGRGGAIAAPIVMGVLVGFGWTVWQLFLMLAVAAAVMTLALGFVRLPKGH